MKNVGIYLIFSPPGQVCDCVCALVLKNGTIKTFHRDTLFETKSSQKTIKILLPYSKSEYYKELSQIVQG